MLAPIKSRDASRDRLPPSWPYSPPAPGCARPMIGPAPRAAGEVTMEPYGEILKGWEIISSADACELCVKYQGQKWYVHPRPGQKSIKEMPELPLHPNCRCRRGEIESDGHLWVAIFDYKKEYMAEPEPGPDAEWNYEDPDLPVLGRVGHTIQNPKYCEAFRKGKVGFFGLIYLSDGYGGSKLGYGPIYGNHGGNKYGHGRDMNEVWEEMTPEQRERYKDPGRYLDDSGQKMPPVDSMDDAFLTHDNEYDFKDPNPFSKDKIAADTKLINTLTKLPEDPRDWQNPPTSDAEVAYARAYRANALKYFRAKIDYFIIRSKRGKAHMLLNYPQLYAVME